VNLAEHVPTYADEPAVLASLPRARRREGIETAFDVHRDDLVDTLRTLRDEHEYQQLMEIAGVDYPDRPERFEVVYCLLSLTRNHRLHIHVATDEKTPVPSVTSLWPVAGWLEREVFDMYGVGFAGNPDLRRILTDYGFDGHPQRKDFPLTGFVEMRYSEAEKRVVYEPVSLAQDWRTFDFLMPWEGAEYRLPGDEKATPEEPGAPSPVKAGAGHGTVNPATPAMTPKTTDTPSDTGAGAPANGAAKRQARKPAKAKARSEVSKASDVPAPEKPGGGPPRMKK
jgi:NADH-quinone oxidoreductase subunit C